MLFNWIKDKRIELAKKGGVKYITTNWQLLIFEYNHNSTQWGWEKCDFDNAVKMYDTIIATTKSEQTKATAEDNKRIVLDAAY